MKIEPGFFERHGWKLIALGLLIFVALASISISRAAGPTATVTWIHPLTYTDISPLAVSEIKETLITWRRPGNATIVGSVRVPGPATTTVVSGLACGNFDFTAATIVKTNSVQSADAGPVLYATGVTCAPNPPTGLVAS